MTHTMSVARACAAPRSIHPSLGELRSFFLRSRSASPLLLAACCCCVACSMGHSGPAAHERGNRGRPSLASRHSPHSPPLCALAPRRRSLAFFAFFLARRQERATVIFNISRATPQMGRCPAAGARARRAQPDPSPHEIRAPSRKHSEQKERLKRTSQSDGERKDQARRGHTAATAAA